MLAIWFLKKIRRNRIDAKIVETVGIPIAPPQNLETKGAVYSEVFPIVYDTQKDLSIKNDRRSSDFTKDNAVKSFDKLIKSYFHGVQTGM